MKTTNRIVALTTLAAAAFLAAACGKKPETKSAEMATAPQAAPAPDAQAQQPKDWIVVDETDYIPVIDELSSELSSARKSFVGKNWKDSADELREAAGLLEKEAAGVSRRDKAQLAAAAKSLRDLAATVEAGKASSVKAIDAAIAKAHRADLERDWLVEETTAWYPYVNSPNTHFQAAHDSFLNREYKKSAEEIRKGAAFVRMEAGSAAGQAKQALEKSERDLRILAKEVEQGSVQDVKRLDNAFAQADQNLALSHRIRANEAWDKKEARKAGAELKAAAVHVENAAAWLGAEAKATFVAAVRDTRLVAGKLTEGTGYTAEEVGTIIASLGKAIDGLGRRIEPQNK